MKLNYLLLLIVPLFIIASSCSDDTEELLGNWSKLSALEGLPRSEAVGFVIDGRFYMGTGYNSDESDRLNDFWEYDPQLNSWTKKADVPGGVRAAAVGFAIDGKGYVGTGYNGDDKLKDFYEYDPLLDKWDTINDFPGSARYGAVSFSVGGKGYVGTGYDGNWLKDFYSYSPATKAWEKIFFNGDKRRDANTFVIGGNAYLISGTDNGSYLNDVWVFNPTSATWTEKNKISDFTDDTFDDDYTTIIRINGCGFTINGKGYLSCGSTGSLLNTVWEYDPTTDLWDDKTPFEGSPRTEGVGFAIGAKGYVTTGRSSTYDYDDIWSFDPNAEYDDLY